ncbi:MAG: sodium:solute symporter [Flavobacteriales bacterium]|nr:sodium:solute symporter [Flavobacteriales bacterium]
MNSTIIITVLILYFGVLYLISRITGKNDGNEAFFVGDRQSPWYLVAFGMIGASLSGVTFISVPGWVGNDANQFSYMQAVLGYFVGYLIIAYVLMPIYYRMKVISIYEYLNDRFGFYSHKTGAIFFLLSRVIGASVRLMLVAEVLQFILFEKWGIPFEFTVAICIALIWIYTNRGGIKTIVWTDTLQTAFMLVSVALTVYFIKDSLSLESGKGIVQTVADSSYSKIFFFDDINNSNHFIKHFFGGIFIAIGMTGLDQDMMQKNLSCRNIREGQKNMISMATVLVFVNLLFLFLGALLYIYAGQHQINPEKADLLFSAVAMDNGMAPIVGILFILGLIAAAYSSADSALTSLTTSIYIDLLPEKYKSKDKALKTRKTIHVLVSLIIILSVIMLHHFTDESAIGLLMKFAAFTYGPLIGIFFFGILLTRRITDIAVPIVSVISVLFTFLIWYFSKGAPGVPKGDPGILGEYSFGFEIIILNAFLTFTLLVAVSMIKTQKKL